MPTSRTPEIEEARRAVSSQLDPVRRAELGQFMTPTPIADFMASLFSRFCDRVCLLDPGAGVGSLAEAFGARFLSEAPKGASLEIEAYEIEPVLLRYLADCFDELSKRAQGQGGKVDYTIHDRDFIAEATFALGFGKPRYTHAILNPPYKKIGTRSGHRHMLRGLGIETVNLYTAFLALAVAHSKDGGEIVAIIPRSFCNGTYFRPFRQWLLDRVALTHIHVFESRSKAFKEDEVLQENIIVHLRRGKAQGTVIVSTSHDSTFSDYKESVMQFSEIVKSRDAESFIHVPTLEVNGAAALFSHSLEQLELTVSTGPVVDFRVRESWLSRPEANCAPMLYAHHFKGGGFSWPKEHKKPNAVKLNDQTRKWLMPRGCYTVTKRFSSKEEKRRLVAYVVEPDLLPYEQYGFENHLNVFHSEKNGLRPEIAHGLALFLNSTLVDKQFRNFSGHTQVNATDLRSMRYPSRELLIEFGEWAIGQERLSQEAIDAFVESRHGE